MKHNPFNKSVDGKLRFWRPFKDKIVLDSGVVARPYGLEQHPSGEWIHKEDLRAWLEEKEKEANEDMKEHGISCINWKEQLDKHRNLRYDQQELMEDACMEFHKAIGKLELLAELSERNKETERGYGTTNKHSSLYSPKKEAGK